MREILQNEAVCTGHWFDVSDALFSLVANGK